MKKFEIVFFDFLNNTTNNLKERTRKMNNMQFLLCLMLTGIPTTIAHQKALLKDIDILVLREGEMTTGRRSSPIPQLSCFGDCRNKPAEVVCKNVGFDGKDIVWDCKADIKNAHFHEASLDVQCEGWEYPEDPYILSGSCGLKYRLNQHTRYIPPPPPSNEDINGSIAIFPIIIILFVMVCICSDTSSYSSSYSDYSPRRYRYDYDSSPGFWSGAAAGYLAGSNRSSWGGSSSWGSSGSSWNRSSGFATTSRR